jgi:hypothetical protein
VIAAYRRLDQTGAVAFAASRDRQQRVAGVRVIERRRGVQRAGGGSVIDVPRDGLAYERSHLLLCHGARSTSSTMPMMAASTGAAFVPSTSPAARPSSTTSTFSRGVVHVQRLHEQQLGAFKFAMLLCRHDRTDHACDLHQSPNRSGDCRLKIAD